MIRFNIAAIRYTDLHPHNPAMMPLANLENRMPVVIPEDTIPTMCPRSDFLLKSPARGRIIWPEIVTIPMLKRHRDNIINDGEKAHESSVITDSIITILISLFLRTKSPIGKINRIPIAYPI